MIHAFRACAVLAVAASCAAADGARVNILHLHADDHRADALHAFGTKALRTPHLDELVARGMTFTRCYTMGAMTPAVCLPSRTMMLTGRSLFRIAVVNKEVPGTTPLPAVLRQAGYQTWRMGKYGNEYAGASRAFEMNIDDSAQGQGQSGSRAYAARRLGDRAIDFLRSRDRARPFYMYLAPPVPHDPREAEPQFHAMYNPDTLPLPPAFRPEHPWDNGDLRVRDELLAPFPRTPEDTRRQLAAYYASITGLDHHFGRVLAALAETGDATNTIVIFSGDNGLSIGDHGLFGKQNLYEFGGMHVPLVVAGPGIRAGRSDALVYLGDLFPTLCELAGVGTPPHEYQSLRPALAGGRAPERSVLFTAYLDVQRAVRDERWKLIRYPKVDRTQLFDLNADPHERNNLVDRPEQAANVARLRAALARESERLGDTVGWSLPAHATR